MIKRRNISPETRDTIVVTDLQASSIASKVIYVAPVKCLVTVFKEVHGTAGNHASAVTGSIERLQGTETSGQGDNLCTAEVSLKGTANTVQTGTLTSTASTKTLAAGDRLGFLLTGNSQTLATMVVTVQFRPVD